ncbi:MAG TPA: amino acid permease [Solirubrobacteraceae bacterium]|jgi:APA family basic amino acid/polyamine antiporter|nr:amino acid permease [Solirubrobacteraceae bacterium]
MSAHGGSREPTGTGAPAARDGHEGRDGRLHAAELTEGARTTLRHSLGSPILFAVVYTSLASAVFFSLGVVADHALGLTPVVFLIAAVMFGVTAMSYAEGASLHPEPGGSTVFARYAFNELVSFVAGWAMLLDYVILIAVTAFAATQYLSVFWAPLGHSGEALLLSIAIIAFVVFTSIRGYAWRREYRIGLIVVAALVLELIAIAIGLVQFFDAKKLVSQVHLGTAPTWSGLIFALTVTTIAFTSVESASGLAGEVKAGRGALRRLIASGTATVVLAYVGVAIVAVTALPLPSATTPGHNFTDAPVIDVLRQLHPHSLSQVFVYLIGAVAACTLVAAADSAMLGLSRLAYSLSVNRQIPSGLGRLHPGRSTPYVLILLAGLMAAALVIPESLDFLVGIYAFGAMLAFTIAHLSVVKMRYSEPLGNRAYKTPFSVRLRWPIGGPADRRSVEVPLLAVFGALVCSAGWIATMVVHEPARYVGLGWMIGGLLLYVIYRRADETSLLRRVTVPVEALRAEQLPERQYGSILVPLSGTRLDEDMVQTAALLAAGEPTEEDEVSTIEAVWIFEMPMSLPLDARLPDAQVKHARQALARAKAVGEEYAGVQVATATIRARRSAQAILEEARRRGVEAIVLGAEEPSRIRGGSRFGGRGGPLENFVGEATKQVVSKAKCRVIVTAPAARDEPELAAGEEPEPVARGE